MLLDNQGFLILLDIQGFIILLGNHGCQNITVTAKVVKGIDNGMSKHSTRTICCEAFDVRRMIREPKGLDRDA